MVVQATRAVWRAPHDASAAASRLQRLQEIAHPIVAQILDSRDTSDEEAGAYLGPDRGPIFEPRLLEDTGRAAERLLRARDARERVAIYGDSDVDGITSVALLDEALTMLGIDTVPYVPNRLEETIGVHIEPLRRFASDGISLVITADCSITDAGVVALCLQAGLDLLVTDHHAPCSVLPGLAAVVNPQRAGCKYPCRDLAGVGVAFKIAQELFRSAGLPDDRARSLLDLVALGTIADMVPLVSENRALVWQGLAVLNSTERPGLRMLAAQAGLSLGSISSTAVGCRICPRLNAAGFHNGSSVGHALLTAGTDEEASIALATIEQRFFDRQQLGRRVLTRCLQAVERDAGNCDSLLAVRIERTEAPVAGYVAGKLVEKCGVAALVFHQSAGLVRGTLRAAGGCSMVDALIANREVLDQFGGHAQAAGFTAVPGVVDGLVERLRDYIACACASSPVAQLRIDAEVSPYEIDWQLYWQLQALEPYGAGNRRPMLLCRRLRVCDFRSVGGAHLQLTLRRGNVTLHAFAYGHARVAESLRRNAEVDLIFTLDLAERDGEPKLQLRVHDIVVT